MIFGVGKEPKVDVNRFGNIPGATGYRDRASTQYGQAGRRAGTAYGQGQEVRGQQEGFHDYLYQQATGQAPSAAQIQLRAGLDQTLAGSLAQAASNPSINPALAQRLAAQQNVQAQTAFNPQMAALRAQEDQTNKGMYAQYLGQMRGQDQQDMQMYESLVAQYLAMGFNMADAQQKALLAAKNVKVQGQIGSQGAKAQTLGAIAQGGATVGAAAITPS